MTTNTAATTPTAWARVVGVIGLLAHLAVGIPYAGTALIAPSWAVAGAAVLWVVLLVVTIVTMVRRPLLTPLVPLAALVTWIIVLVAGSQFLGWTA